MAQSEVQTITIPSVRLEWNPWVPWGDLTLDARGSDTPTPPNLPGVYEVRFQEADRRIYIGRASNLRMRVKQGLVQGKVPHSGGKRMRQAGVATTDLVVRWAIMDRPAAVEEELLRLHKIQFGSWPQYVLHA